MKRNTIDTGIDQAQFDKFVNLFDLSPYARRSVRAAQLRFDGFSAARAATSCNRRVFVGPEIVPAIAYAAPNYLDQEQLGSQKRNRGLKASPAFFVVELKDQLADFARSRKFVISFLISLVCLSLNLPALRYDSSSSAASLKRFSFSP